jgi:hypothetical protein
MLLIGLTLKASFNQLGLKEAYGTIFGVGRSVQD